MDYKISIHGKNFYKEIELTKSWVNELSIGTTKECQMRFSRASFEIDFVVMIASQNGQWMAKSDEAIYLQKRDGTWGDTFYLVPGDTIAVCDRSNHEELFCMEFSIDFVKKTMDFDKIIVCTGCQEFTVGGVQGCTIRVTDPVVSGDYVRFVREGNRWMIDSQNARYGILLNGFPVRNQYTPLQDRDMIALNGFYFYWSEQHLYTSVETDIITKFTTKEKRWQKNNL